MKNMAITTYDLNKIKFATDPHTAQEITRHKDYRTFKRYVHLSTDHKKRAVNVLSSVTAQGMDTKWSPALTQKKEVSQVVENNNGEMREWLNRTVSKTVACR